MSSVSLSQYLKYIWRVSTDALETEHYVYLLILVVFALLAFQTGIIKRDEIKRFTPEATNEWRQKIIESDECIYIQEERHKFNLVCR